MNETFKRQSSMQLVDASMPFLENGVANPVKLYAKVLDGFGIGDPGEYINEDAAQGGPPPPGGGPPPPGGGPQPALPPGPPPSNPMEEMMPGEQMMPGDMMEPGEMGGEDILSQLPPEILQQLPPQIIEGIQTGQIPPEMVVQMLQEMMGQGPPQGMPDQGMPPGPMM
jgi:hypothetical protein